PVTLFQTLSAPGRGAAPTLFLIGLSSCIAAMKASSHEKLNRVFPLRVRGVFEFTSAVATGTSKALAGQLSPQEALDEVAKEWEAIVNRVGKKNVQEDYAVGVKMEDNQL
ncbi:hypothetical protein N9O39_03745, partial [Candidatus Pelagibacter sp.]|nr:hypothetical protein [Candidatus Pelagibacter sp.]